VEDWQIVIIVVLLLYVFFKRRIWGWLDPLFLFLAIRIATAITVSGQYLFSSTLEAPGILHMTLCLFIFTVSLWVFSPKIEHQKTLGVDSPLQTRHLFRISLGVLIFKALILMLVYDQLPIIASEMGSDSYIAFDMSNKVSSSFLLGIGSFDTVLLACVVPLLTSRKEKIAGWFALIVSVSLSILTLKKGGILNVMFAVALGEYLRLYYFSKKTRVFIKPGILGTGLVVAVIWAYFVYSATAGNVEFENINDILNFVSSQFMYPYSLYASGDIYNFAQYYQFNHLFYFFHSLLSPLGYPAFHASIGPALHEYQTGVLTGNGINPTFVIEGYIVFGKVLSVMYSLSLGMMLGFVRRALLSYSLTFNRKVALTALFLPPLYVFPIDALLSIKEMLVCFLMIVCYLFIVGFLKNVPTYIAPHKHPSAKAWLY
jgi:oligosaccharide repeat unit polymerase